MVVDGVNFVCNEEISEDLALAYIRELRARHPEKHLTNVKVTFDGDYADIEYHFTPQNFERIRRITGYLVGTIDRWNNGKRAEEHDRVKHFFVGTDEDLAMPGMERI